ncbi:MAG: hypothetical protein J1E96_04535 [Ruminococcus sp.]|nr:hypothetical protein [Ruminococcus sp.]
MVKIFNIALRGKTISCDYLPEDSTLKGHIEVNTETGEIETVVYSKYKYAKETYASFAKRKLIDVYKDGEPFPDQAVSMWY